MAERLNARDSKSCIRGDSYRGFKSLLIRQLKNALNKLGVFLSDESVQTSPQACFHGEGSEFS